VLKDPNHLVQRVRRKLEIFGLNPGCPNPPVVLALSCGPDSTALLWILHQLQAPFQYTLSAAHLNHGLRGAESRADQDFAAGQCRQLGLELDTAFVDLPCLKNSTGENLHALARKHRYRFLEQTAVKRQASRVLTGHHLDDQIETFLLSLFRGAGRRGLSAMSEVRPLGRVCLCRPMLEISREEILNFLCTNEISFRQDASNQDTSYERNWLRHKIMPRLERRRPNLKRRLLETAKILREEEEYLDSVFQQIFDDLSRHRATAPSIPGQQALWSCPLVLIEKLHPVLIRRLIRHLVVEFKPEDKETAPGKISAQVLDCLLGERPQWEIRLGENLKIARRYEYLVVYSGNAELPENWIVLPEGAECLVNALGGSIKIQRKPAGKNALPEIKMESRINHRVVYFDASGIHGPLALRSRKPGDRMPVLGLGGSRKIKDLMMDAKLTVEQRKQPRLLVLGNDILWTIGCAINDHFKVTPETRQLLRVEFNHSDAKERNKSLQ